MAEKGMSIFLDVFRRANKKDDGAISLEEFLVFFSDGVMGKEELESLFHEIDTHNTDNIDTNELCAYFSKHLGEFKEIYGLVEELNNKISSVLQSTSQTYKDLSRTDQFINRFIIHEVLNQISAVQRPVDAACDALDEQSRGERADITPVNTEQNVKKSSGIIPGRVVRRAKRQMSNPALVVSPHVHDNLRFEVNSALTSQIDRLTALLDRMENKVNFDGFTDEELTAEEDQKTLLLQIDLAVKEDEMDNFRNSVRDYVEATNNAPGCLSISVQHYMNSVKFSIYEVWSTADQQSSYSQSDASKNFLQKCETHLSQPVDTRSVLFPASWWKKDY
ncbi:hypothetical protein ScPMuIL_000436 [Solemya velum]